MSSASSSDPGLELDPHANPAGWPAQVIPMVARALTCQYASLTRSGTPVTWPVTPFVNDDRRSIDVSTGLVYPAKAERARRNSNVALLINDAIGLTLEAPPTVLVLGTAAVRDADLQANTDRYLVRSHRKLPAVFRQAPWAFFGAQSWYWTRMWVEVTPLRILWWQHKRLNEPPRVWEAEPGTEPKTSDPRPPGSPPGAWQNVDGGDWRAHAAYSLGRIGHPTLTFVHEGWPVPVPVAELKAAPDGFYARLPEGLPFMPSGPVCVTFHTHADKFVGQDNSAFIGVIDRAGDRWLISVERRLGDFALPGGRLKRMRRFLGYGRRLRPRLEDECRRRGQPAPIIRYPKKL